MSDAKDMPRDGAAGAAKDEEPVRDRPGGPGLTGMRVVGPGQVAPGPPTEEERPEEDQTVTDRREHLRDKEQRS